MKTIIIWSIGLLIASNIQAQDFTHFIVDNTIHSEYSADKISSTLEVYNKHYGGVLLAPTIEAFADHKVLLNSQVVPAMIVDALHLNVAHMSKCEFEAKDFVARKTLTQTQVSFTVTVPQLEVLFYRLWGHAQGDSVMLDAGQFTNVKNQKISNTVEEDFDFYTLELSTQKRGYRTSLWTQGQTSDQLSIFPNPASTYINIEVPLSDRSGYMTISDISGRIIETSTLSGSTQPLDISTLHTGVYLITCYPSRSQGILTVR